MNIKDFLIDNYIWIIVIILITIITIIGFLADRKKSDKKKEELAPANPNLNNASQQNMGQLQYGQPIATMQNQANNNVMSNSNMMNNMVNNQMLSPMDGMFQQNQNIANSQDFNNMNYMNQVSSIPQMEQPMPTMTTPMEPNLNSNNQPIEIQTPNVLSEPFYQPLSEQTPNVAPQPAQNYFNNSGTTEVPISTDNIINQSIPTTLPMDMPMQNQVQQSDVNNSQIIGMQEFNQINGTIPNPINQIPVPQPIIPQPIMTNTVDTMNYTNNQNLNTTIPMGVPAQNIQQPQMPEQQNILPQMNNDMGMNYNEVTPQQSTNSQMVQNNLNQQSPISFVFGPQNNNPNM